MLFQHRHSPFFQHDRFCKASHGIWATTDNSGAQTISSLLSFTANAASGNAQTFYIQADQLDTPRLPTATTPRYGVGTTLIRLGITHRMMTRVQQDYTLPTTQGLLGSTMTVRHG